MAETRSTPGPWSFERDYGSYRIPEIGIMWARSHSTDSKNDARIIASEQGQREEANARIIAAAPELAEALLALVGAIEIADNPADMGVGADEEVMLKAREVLKKAGLR